VPASVGDKQGVVPVRPRQASAGPVAAAPVAAPRDRVALSSAADEQGAARRGHRIGVGIGAGLSTVFNAVTLREAAKLVAAGKPAGVFLGKVTPALAVGISGYTLYDRFRKGFSGTDNVRKWDDALRVAGDALQVGGGVAAFVPAVGLVPGMVAITAGTLVTALGDFFDDEVGKPAR
jgi:hypothetical protein